MYQKCSGLAVLRSLVAFYFKKLPQRGIYSKEQMWVCCVVWTNAGRRGHRWFSWVCTDWQSLVELSKGFIAESP